LSRELLRDAAFVRMIEGAGHWVQQQQPDRVNQLLIDVLLHG